jgi:hypothetical protein
MDNAKITLLSFQVANKMIFRLGQLLITLISMIMHGHSDEIYVQYFNELWPNDPNFTIGSLLWFFRTLEKTIVSKFKILFENLPHNAFFVDVLQGKSCCTCELKMPNWVVGPNDLLKNLLLQMDNCVKDNKNW